jgi:hypothetical protein
MTPDILPDEELNALRSDLPNFKSVDTATADKLIFAAQSPTLGHSVEVFTIGVPDILPGGNGLAAATSAGWRLAAAFGATTIACDMYTVARGGPQPLPQGTRRLACMRTGDQVNKLLIAIAGLQQIAGQPPATDFRIRLLIMPALFTDALWLLPMSLNTADSKLVAYDTLVDGITPGAQYSPADFIKLLVPVAQYWKDNPVKSLLKPSYESARGSVKSI